MKSYKIKQIANVLWGKLVNIIALLLIVMHSLEFKYKYAKFGKHVRDWDFSLEQSKSQNQH